MKTFIELTSKEDKRVLINVNYIFRVEDDEVKGETVCRICFTPKGYNSYPYQSLEPKESYDEVLSKIKDAVSQ